MPEAKSPAATDAAEITSRILLETKAVLFRPDEPFTFTSGRVSPVYVDCRRLISFPRARAKLMDLAVETVTRAVGFEAFDAVAGGETAGIPFAAWVSERMGLPMLYVRKKAKGFGRNAQIEGEMKEGASKLNFIHAIRDAGGEIGHAFVIFHYGIFPKSVEMLAAEEVTLHSLATFWDVLKVAHGLGYFTPEQYKAVRSYLENPDGWAPAAAPAR